MYERYKEPWLKDLAKILKEQGTELCAVVELMYTCEKIYEHTGEEKWLRRLETIAFNALPATISEDMWTHQYVQMTNQIACRPFPGKSIFRSNVFNGHLFKAHLCCCTANFGQGWPKLALSTYGHCGDKIVNNLMLPGVFTTEKATITLETDYPFKHSFKYKICAKLRMTELPVVGEKC